MDNPIHSENELSKRVEYLKEEIKRQEERLKKYEAAHLRSSTSFYQNNGIYQGLKIALAIMNGRTKSQ